MLAVLKNAMAELPVATYMAGKRDVGSGGEEMGLISSCCKNYQPKIAQGRGIKEFLSSFLFSFRSRKIYLLL